MSNPAAVAPQASAAMSRVLAAAMAKQEQQQVSQAEPGSQTALSPDADHRETPHFGSRRRKRPPQPAEEKDDSPGEAPSPLIGNLLNIKV